MSKYFWNVLVAAGIVQGIIEINTKVIQTVVVNYKN